MLLRIEPNNIKGFGKPPYLQAASLPDGIMDQALVPAQLSPLKIDNRAIAVRFGPNLANDRCIVTLRHEANILTVRLVRNNEPQFLRNRPHLRLGHSTQWKAQIRELLDRGCEKEVTLVARRIERTVQFRTRRSIYPSDIMAGREAIRAQFFCQPE